MALPNTSLPVVADREAVLRYLQQEELLNSEGLVVLIVDRSYRVIKRLDEPLDDVSPDLPQQVVLACVGAGASGVLFVENYPKGDVFNSFDSPAFYHRVGQLLTETEIFLIDILVLSAGQIRSGLGLRRTLNSKLPLRR